MKTRRLMLQSVWAVALVALLTACGSIGASPNQHLVERAIAQQISQTQQELSQQLRLDSRPTKVSIDQVKITEEIPLIIQGLQAYQIRGTYSLNAELIDRQVTQPKNSFEVYLQRQKEGKTWRLARLITDKDETAWVTQSIQ